MSAEPSVDLLRLSGLKAIRTHEEDGALIITCHGPREKPEKCCGASNWSGNGLRKARFRDFSIQKQPVFLQVDRQKWKCSRCEAKFTEEIEVIHNRKTSQDATDRFVDAVVLDSTDATFAAASKQHGIHESFARRSFDDYAAKKLAGYKPIMPLIVGIDEKYIKGVAHFVIGDVGNKRLLEVLPTNKIDDLRDWFSRIDDRDNVEVICQDMFPGYKSIGPDFFPKAKIVIDKWHVMKAANKSIAESRRHALGNQNQPVQADLFDNEIASLPYSKDRYTVPERVESSVHYSDKQFRFAYYYRQWFYEIYNRVDGRHAAERELNYLFKHMPKDMRMIFKSLCYAFENNYKGITNYFSNPYTNAYIERLNGMIGALERNGSGLGYFTLRAKALLSYSHLKSEPLYQRIPGPSRPRRPRTSDPLTSEFITMRSSNETNALTDAEPDWAAIAPRGGADLEILTAVLETGTL